MLQNSSESVQRRVLTTPADIFWWFPYLRSHVQALLIRLLVFHFHRKQASTGKDRRIFGEMRSLKKCSGEDVAYHLLITVVAAVLLQAIGAFSVATPNTGCYALDNSSHIHDFSSWIGQPFEYEGKGKDADLVVRFCKDVESRSQAGYVDYGRFDKINYFRAGSGHVSFVQEYFNGDLMNCEQSYDKMGRTAKVNIICGNCPHGQCKDFPMALRVGEIFHVPPVDSVRWFMELSHEVDLHVTSANWKIYESYVGYGGVQDGLSGYARTKPITLVTEYITY